MSRIVHSHAVLDLHIKAAAGSTFRSSISIFTSSQDVVHSWFYFIWSIAIYHRYIWNSTQAHLSNSIFYSMFYRISRYRVSVLFHVIAFLCITVSVHVTWFIYSQSCWPQLAVGWPSLTAIIPVHCQWSSTTSHHLVHLRLNSKPSASHHHVTVSGLSTERQNWSWLPLKSFTTWSIPSFYVIRKMAFIYEIISDQSLDVLALFETRYRCPDY